MDASPLWSLDWVRAVQGWGAWLLPPMQAATFFGSPGFAALLIVLCYWCIDKRAGRDLVLLMILSGYGNTLLKAITQRARPYWLDPSVGRAVENSYSFPSGHSQTAAVLFGYLAWRLIRAARSSTTKTRRAVSLGAAALILLIPLIALSRVYLGVHFPGDVLLGMAVGLLILVLYLWLAPSVGHWLAARPGGVTVALALGAAALVWFSIRGALNLPSAVGDPSWRAMAEAMAMTDAATFAGTMIGGPLGFMLEARHVRFSVGGAPGQRALRFGLGLAGLGVFVLAVGAIAPTALIRDAVQGAAATFWVAFLWPWLFVRFGLAASE